jgi:serine/threonine protein kinase
VDFRSLFDSSRNLALRTLNAIHKLGWVHGDPSPSNLALDAKGVVTILDFSHACRVSEVSQADQESEFEEFESILTREC